MSRHKVTVRDLQKRYGSVEAARGVSFEIRDGEIFGLLGPNGAGKTTTLECVIGLREPDEGEIEVCGIDARRRPREVKAEDRRRAADHGAAGQDHAARGAGALRLVLPRQADAGGAARALRARRQGRRAVRHAVGRPAAAARAGARLRQQARARLSRRADDRARPAVAARAARRDRADEARRPHGAADHALHRRGRAALRSHRDHRSRPHHRHRHAARADRRSSATPSVLLTTVQPLERDWLASFRASKASRCEGTSARFRIDDASARPSPS